MAQAPILGAGGIVVRGGDTPLIAVVQRRKDNAWVLPKGKLKSKESAIAAAEREVMEETGQDVIVHEFLGAISYTASGKPKLVQFWRMEAADLPARKLTKDIKAVKWLALEPALKKLADPLEQVFLRNVAERALAIALPIVEPAATAKSNRKRSAVAPAEQPTAMTLPIVEPSFRAKPPVREGHETLPALPAQIVAEQMPKPSVLPTPIPKQVVLATSAPTQIAPAAPARPAPVTMMPAAARLIETPRVERPLVTPPEERPVAMTSTAGPPVVRTPTVAMQPATRSPVVAKPAAEPPVAMKPATALRVVTNPASEPSVAANPVARRPVVTKLAEEPTVVARPATQTIPERNVVAPPIAEPSAPLNLFGRVLQRLQRDWSDRSQRRHWTTGIARRTGR
jgi:8-oxo-dGTP diphosphatase